MILRVLGLTGLGVALVLTACSSGPCGGATCSDTQRCTATQVCVTDESPTLELELPAENQAVTGSMVTVKGTANDDTAVAQLLFTIENAQPTDVPFPGGGKFTADIPVPAIDGKVVTLTATAIDPKVKKTSVTRKLTVDNVAPTCGLSVPAVVNAVTDVAVTTTAADGSGQLSNARLSTDGALTFAPVTANTFTWTLSSENGVLHDLVFRVDDAAGHTCEATAKVLVDNVKPTVGFSFPDAGALLGPRFFADGGVLTGPVSDGTRALKSVAVAFADAGTLLASVANGQWSVTVAAPTDDFVARTATVTATDLADNTASATLGVTVDVVAPTLTVTAPAANAKLNIASFDGGNDVTVAFTLTDGDPQTAVVLTLPDGGQPATPRITTSPTDNPKSYAATLTATDRAGNAATAALAFSVDRVAPTLVSSVPANNTRNAGSISATFSEPMAATGSGLVLSPDAGGAWTSSTTWTVTTFERDTAYTAAQGTSTDLQGNPIVAASFRLHTAPWTPDAGVAFGTGYAVVDSAVADHDGVLNLLVHDAADGGHWLRYDPRTGVPLDFPTGITSAGLLSAWRTVLPDLSARRVSGCTISAAGVSQVQMNFDGTHVNGPLDEAFLPTPAFAGEGTGLGEYGTIHKNGTQLEYARTGRANLPIDLTQIDGLAVTATRWELFQHNIASIGSQTYGCIPNVISGAPPICELRPVDAVPATFGSAPRVEASSTSCSVVSPGAGQMTTYFTPWQPDCGNFGRPACVPKSTAMAAARDLASNLNNEGTFYSVEGTGPYQVRKLVLGGGCVGSWTNVGAPVALPTKPALVVIRGVPGLVYADASGNLKLAVP